MVERCNKIRNKVLVNFLAIVVFIAVSSLVSDTNIGFAQELSDEVRQLAMIQYTLQYRFADNLKVGDRVKYERIEQGAKAGEIELEVTQEEKTGFWIVEKFQGNEFHLLVDLKQMKLLKALSIDKEGKKHEAIPLSDEKVANLIEMFKKQMEQGRGASPIIGWVKSEKTEKVDISTGSFTCVYLKPKFSEQYAKETQDYVKKMEKEGKSAAEIEKWKKEPRLYFSKDVPRLLPLMIAGGWMPFIDVFKEVKGGLVKCTQTLELELTAYSGQKK
jgi:hypothetical protein